MRNSKPLVALLLITGQQEVHNIFQGAQRNKMVQAAPVPMADGPDTF